VRHWNVLRGGRRPAERRREAEIREELDFHLAAREEEARTSGLTGRAARREAERAFGDRGRIERELRRLGRRRARRAARAGWLEGVRVDATQSLRAWRRRPAVPALVVVTLALAMGATTAVYTLFDRIVLNPLPLDPAGLYVLGGTTDEGDRSLSYPEVNALGEAAGWDGLAGAGALDVTVRMGESSEQLTAALVTGSYFGVLGLRPAAGRLLQPADEAAQGSTPYAVVSESLWRRWYGGDRDVVGRTLHVNGRAFTIVGVAAAGFRGTNLGERVDVWLPITMVRSIGSGGIYSMSNVLEVETLAWLTGVARLAGGADARAAVAALDARFVARQRALPRSEEGALGPDLIARLHAVPIREAATGRNRSDLLRLMATLWIVVAICLAIACVNVANLLLLRASERWRELGVRMALGAGRARLFRQLIVESVVLGGLAGVAGLLVARLAMHLLAAYSLPGDIAIADAPLDPDPRVFAFAAALAGATALLFGLAPAIWASRPSLMRGVREARHGAAPAWRGGSVLIAVQVALSVVLVVGALLFTRSLQRGFGVDLGYRVRGVAALEVHAAQSGYAGDAEKEFLRRLVTTLAARPGIDAAALAVFAPPGNAGLKLPVAAAATGRQPPDGRIAINAVTADYLPLLEVPLIAGRMLEPADERPDGPAVAVITARVARELWPDVDPLGQTLELFPGYMNDRWTVVGVVGDARFGALDDVAPSIFMPYARFASRVNATLLAVSDQPIEQTIATMRRTVRELDPDIPVFHVRSLRTQLAGLLATQRMGATLLGLFAALALAVSGIGIYATVACDVARRRRDLGIRSALGAPRRRLAASVLRPVAASLLAGAATGLAAAAVLNGGLRAFLFGITPHEPASYLAAPVVLAVVAIAAAWIPTRRALATDPGIVLRDGG
jgi:predicted permease